MDNQTLDLYILSDSPRRYRSERQFAIKEERPGCLTIRLSSEVVQKLGIVAGLDYATQTIEGNHVILTFCRKGDISKT